MISKGRHWLNISTNQWHHRNPNHNGYHRSFNNNGCHRRSSYNSRHRNLRHITTKVFYVDNFTFDKVGGVKRKACFSYFSLVEEVLPIIWLMFLLLAEVPLLTELFLYLPLIEKNIAISNVKFPATHQRRITNCKVKIFPLTENQVPSTLFLCPPPSPKKYWYW